MKTLITGGAGFIGSYLCEHFLDKGHEVICMDNLITGNVDNVSHLFGSKGFTFVNYDVTNFIYVEGELDYALHFASPASPADYLKWPIQTLKVGALGTHKALGLAKAKGAKFLIASTSETYGDPLVHPQPEDYWGNVNPIGTRGVYDEAKRFAEAMTMAYHRYHGVDTRIVRIFNTFGPRMRMDDGRAVPTFICQALRGDDITVFGDGTQTRSFGYITDLVSGIDKLMESDIHTPVNIGNPEEMSVIEMAELIVRLSGSKSRIILDPMPKELGDDPKVRRPDITKAKELLGWEPRVSIEEGISKTIEWFREKLSEIG